jgi:spore coat polysaccharide biosynthesis protein SpsF
MVKVVASIEARMNSSRYPGKILADISGQPTLTRLVRRLRRCRTLDGVVVATTASPADDPVVAWAGAEGVACFRGSEDDVLGRVVGAHAMMGSDVVVELTGDCPLTDPAVVDLAVDTFLANGCDVVSTTQKRSFPPGVDAQVFRADALAEVAALSDDPAVREHVSLYFYEHPERYRILHLVAPGPWRGDVRLLVDYPEDMDLMRAIWRQLEPAFGDAFTTGDVLDLMRREPRLAELNRHCAVKAVR